MFDKESTAILLNWVIERSRYRQELFHVFHRCTNLSLDTMTMITKFIGKYPMTCHCVWTRYETPPTVGKDDICVSTCNELGMIRLCPKYVLPMLRLLSPDDYFDISSHHTMEECTIPRATIHFNLPKHVRWQFGLRTFDTFSKYYCWIFLLHDSFLVGYEGKFLRENKCQTNCISGPWELWRQAVENTNTLTLKINDFDSRQVSIIAGPLECCITVGFDLRSARPVFRYASLSPNLSLPHHFVKFVPPNIHINQQTLKFHISLDKIK